MKKLSTSSTLPLQSIQKRLQQEKADAYIIPHEDAFRNEYLPACAERIFHITGFQGSAGLVFVFQDSAYLFVDGRYTTAAKMAIDASSVTVIDWTTENIQDLLKTLPSQGKVLYDPWTITHATLQHLVYLGKTLSFFPSSSNWVDDVWENQPAFPRDPLVLYPEEYAGESSSQKRSRLAAFLQEQNIGAAYIALPESINWLLNIRGSDVRHTPLALCHAIFHKDQSVDVFIPLEKVSSDVKFFLGNAIRFHEWNALPNFLENVSLPSRMLVDEKNCPEAIIRHLQKRSLDLSFKEDLCLLPKAIKNQTQQDGMRAAHMRDGAALVAFLSFLEDYIQNKGALRETEAATLLEEFRSRQPLFQGLSFDTIAATGSNGAIVHYRPEIGKDRLLKPGELFLLDSGGQYLDGTTDVTRTILLGDGVAAPEIKDAYTRVLKGHIALAKQKFSIGTGGSTLDILARQFLWNVGMDYAHGTGHGVGSFLSVHEGPQSISRRLNRCPLQPGMVLSNEPGYYKTGEYGIRLENLVLVTESIPGFYQFETLTMTPFDYRLIEMSMLAPEEISWLNMYHAKIRENLLPFLPLSAVEWLKRYTNPL